MKYVSVDTIRRERESVKNGERGGWASNYCGVRWQALRERQDFRQRDASAESNGLAASPARTGNSPSAIRDELARLLDPVVRSLRGDRVVRDRRVAEGHHHVARVRCGRRSRSASARTAGGGRRPGTAGRSG